MYGIFSYGSNLKCYVIKTEDLFFELLESVCHSYIYIKYWIWKFTSSLKEDIDNLFIKKEGPLEKQNMKRLS